MFPSTLHLMNRYLYRYFSDQKYLMAAIQCVRFAFDSYDARHGWPMWGHQLAWGAAELYKDTYDTKVLSLARQLGQMLVERQHEMGYFPYTEWYTENEPPRITYSICAQSTVWLSKVREAIRLSMTRGTDGTTTNTPSFKGLGRRGGGPSGPWPCSRMGVGINTCFACHA